MLLAIDAGNTDITFALHENQQWIHEWRIPSKQEPSIEAWQFKLVNECLELGRQEADIDQVVISSVVPSITQPLMEMIQHALGFEALVVGPDIYPQLNIHVTNEKEIGTDLVANAVAAYARYQGKCIIVDFGTALTFTTVLQNGNIAGVAIAPGLNTAVRALFSHTAQLPEVPLEEPESALGKDTIHAIQAGIMLGYTGMVRHLLDQIKGEIGTDAKVIATEGYPQILPLYNQFLMIWTRDLP